MITVNKANPTPGEVTSSLTNTADGGLHFDGAAGNVDIASPPDLGTKFSFEFILKAGGTGSSGKIVDFGDGGRFVIEHNTSGLQVKPSNSGGWVTLQSPSPLADLEVHHLVATVDNTALKLYDQGNQVAAITIAAPDIDSCADAKIGSYYDSATDLFNGTISRTRFYNRVLSGSEIKEKFENKNLEFSEMWASQTDLINANSSNSGTSWTGASSSTAPTGWSPAGSPRTYTIDSSSGSGSEPALKIEAGAANVGIKWGGTATLGKKYRLSFSYKNGDADTVMAYRLTDAGSFVNLANSTSWSHNNVVEFTGDGVTGGLMFRVNTSGKLGHFDNIKLEAVGCVSDYCLSEASPSASLMLADRSTNGVDGTISASGVTAIAKPIQLNATAISVSSSTARTPADGAIVADTLGVGTVSSFADSQAAIVGSDNVGLALQSTNAGKSSRVRFFDNSGNQDATVGFDNSNSSLFMGTGTNAHLTISSAGHVSMTSSDADAQLTLTGTGTNAPSKLDFVPQGTGNARIQVGGSDKVTISSTGETSFLLDNSTTAGTGLTIQNAASTDGGTTTDPNAWLKFKLNSVRNGAMIKAGRDSAYGSASAADGNLQFLTALDDTLTERMTIRSNGAVRIGDSSLLEFGGDTAGIYGVAGASGYVAARVNNAERFKIDPSGYVSIGSPSATPLQSGMSKYLQLSAGNVSGTACAIEMQGNRTGGGDVNNRISFFNNTSEIAKIECKYEASTTNGSLNFYTAGNATPRLKLAETGLATFTNGITLSGGITTLGSMSELTIASGGITVTSSVHTVDTESDAASDNLNTVNGGTDGSILILKSVTGTRDVTLKDSSDNLRLAGDFALSSANDSITLIKSGSNWLEISRSDNA